MHAALAETVFAALRVGAVDELRRRLTPESTWEIPGRSVLAGTHRGPDAILAALRPVEALRPIRPDAYDVMSSEYHAVLTTRLVADGLDSEHAIVIVSDEAGHLVRAFHYLFDLYGFDEYFARSSAR
jgi:ketosteroid isomerase-like protein